MANAFEAMKVHIEVSGWVFALGHLQEWREANPSGTIDDYVAEVRQQTIKAKERFVELEVENGSTREAAVRTAQMMR
ncbi:hypothetical protein SUDANB1_07215 [Streptomyces sp. enrichment culture]|uniref:hypothetical protein n=1 Tax=Streptomyces sp. enrichment culture TaxID=1795815 RepID=UPI003F5597F7